MVAAEDLVVIDGKVTEAAGVATWVTEAVVTVEDAVAAVVTLQLDHAIEDTRHLCLLLYITDKRPAYVWGYVVSPNYRYPSISLIRNV